MQDPSKYAPSPSRTTAASSSSSAGAMSSSVTYKIGNKKFKLGKRIGSGSFGSIHHGINVQTGEEVAVKLVCLRSFSLLRSLFFHNNNNKTKGTKRKREKKKLKLTLNGHVSNNVPTGSHKNKAPATFVRSTSLSAPSGRWFVSPSLLLSSFRFHKKKKSETDILCFVWFIVCRGRFLGCLWMMKQWESPT